MTVHEALCWRDERTDCVTLYFEPSKKVNDTNNTTYKCPSQTHKYKKKDDFL